MSNVVFDRHSVDSMGDISHIGNINQTPREKKSEGNVANSADYHFHSTIQHVEDGLIEQWKEQNKNMNENRSNEVSSLTDAKFRKLATTMIFPIFYNLGSLFVLLLIIPIFFAFKSESNLIITIGSIIGIGLFSSIMFDAYIIYRVRKYVIESVTNRYYSIIRKAWRSYEFFSIITIAILLYIVSFHLNSDLLIIENSKIMNKLFSYFDLKIYKFTFTTISILYFFIYFTITKMVSKKAIKEQRRSVIEARSGSEHNADVAGAILNGTLGDFENEK